MFYCMFYFICDRSFTDTRKVDDRRRRRPIDHVTLMFHSLEITPLLRQLHWLKASERIAFKCAVLVVQCVFTAPHRRTSSMNCKVTSRLVSDSVLPRLHH